MKLEQKDKSLLFSHTEIPDVFFTEYLPLANGDYVKVYIYMLFLSNYNKEANINELSKILGLPFNTVQDAFKFWEEQAVITKKNTGYILNNLQEIENRLMQGPYIHHFIEIEGDYLSELNEFCKYIPELSIDRTLETK